MLTFSEVVGNMLEAWPVWIFIGCFVFAFWRLSKSKGGSSNFNFMGNPHNDLDAQYRGLPGSNGVVSTLSHRGLNLMKDD